MTPLKRTSRVLVLIVFVAAVFPAIVTGQCPPPPPESLLAEGEIGLFFDPLGIRTCADIQVGVPTPLYVVARVPEGGVAQFAVPELLAPELPAGLFFVSAPGLPPGGPYEMLVVVDGCNQARRTDPSSCPVSQGDLLVISMTEVIAFVPLHVAACFQTACPTFSGAVAMPPSYSRCDTGAGGDFTGWSGMCIGFGLAPVPTESSTWGAIKAVYGE